MLIDAGALAVQRSAPIKVCSLCPSLHGVPHCLEGRKLGVVELPVYLFDLADIDVVHDIPGLRIDGHWAARAFPGHALHRRQQGIAVGSAAGPF